MATETQTEGATARHPAVVTAILIRCSLQLGDSKKHVTRVGIRVFAMEMIRIMTAQQIKEWPIVRHLAAAMVTSTHRSTHLGIRSVRIVLQALRIPIPDVAQGESAMIYADVLTTH